MKEGRSFAISSVAFFTLSKAVSVFGGKTSKDKDYKAYDNNAKINLTPDTATDIYYSLNTILPNDAKLTWRQVEGSDGNNYYTTGTVVVQNTGENGSVLSITNMKWTFSQNGGKGYFRIPTPVENAPNAP